MQGGRGHSQLRPHPPDTDPQWADGGSGEYTRPASGYQHARKPTFKKCFFLS